MIKVLKITLIVIALFGFNAYSQSKFEYVSPKPDAKMVSKETNIIIRQGDIIDPLSLIEGQIIVLGVKSGMHKGRMILADDNKTILFLPETPFVADELVSVDVNSGIRNIKGNSIGKLRFRFTTTPLNTKVIPSDKMLLNISGYETIPGERGNLLPINKISEDSIPSDFPEIKINSSDNPAPGYIFLTVSRDVEGIGLYNMILDNSGKPVRYFKEDHYSYDFKVQKNNLLSYADISESHWYAGGGETTHKILDSNLTVIDSFKAGNGYVADSHDFQLLPNGHALLFAYDLQPVDMSKIVEGGDPGALIAGSIIQEIDANKNVVFEWRSWDYIPITDSYQNLTLSAFDYIHVNSIEPDFDGNILISCRQTSEIIKINRTTGEIMWRMGGKRNEFTFINETAANAPDYFSLQHSCRRLENGNVILFDNGNSHKPKYSRAVEYQLDEINRIATLIWEYRHSPDVFGASRGSVQRLPNGNTLIGWGSYSEANSLALTEVTPDKKVVFELSIPKGLSSYRAFRFPYFDYSPEASVTHFDLLPLNVYVFNDNEDITGVKIKFSKLNIAYNTLTVTKHNNASINPKFASGAPIILPIRIVVQQEAIDDFKADLRFDQSYFRNISDPQNVVVYCRSNEGSGIFEPVPTSYDNVNKEIVAVISRFGEFILGRAYPSQVPGIPLLVSPVKNDSVNQTLPVEIRWTPKGYSVSYTLQVATDPDFNTFIVNDSTLNSSIYNLNGLLSNSKYFWRVKSRSYLGESAFSNPGVFYTTAPFIKIIYPNGGEILQPGKDYFVRWEDNLSEAVTVKLYKNDEFHSIIADSVLSIGSYKFSIPQDFQIDSVYRFQISSTSDTLVSDESDRFFSIRSVVSDVGNPSAEITYSLEQNYPNPFNPSTSIRYSVAMESMVELKIFNALGEEIEAIVSKIQSKGFYEVTWAAKRAAAGIYFYSLTAVPLNSEAPYKTTKKMIILK